MKHTVTYSCTRTRWLSATLDFYALSSARSHCCMYFAAPCRADCRLFCCACGTQILWLSELGLCLLGARRRNLKQAKKQKKKKEKTATRGNKKKHSILGIDPAKISPASTINHFRRRRTERWEYIATVSSENRRSRSKFVAL